MIRLAFRNLFQNTIRLLISAGGVSLALLLILSLDAIFNGVDQQITAYINHSNADVIVSQAAVRNLHMASSSLPGTIVDKVRSVPGVQEVTPILYISNMVVIGDERNLAYIIGLPANAEMGGPWQMAAGSDRPLTGEAIIDRNVATKSGMGVGDQVKILGRSFKIAGLSEGTASLVNSIAFISMADFAALRGNSTTISFLFVKVIPGNTPAEVAVRIEKQITNVTAQTQDEFAMQERKVVKDMSTDVITIMNLVGFLIGLAVMALTVYTATLSRLKEYGVLKALGASNAQLYQTVLAQALISIAIGFGTGLAFTFLLSAITLRLGLDMILVISPLSLLKVSGLSLIIAAISAVLPIKQITRLDPVTVFRGK